MFNKCRIKSDLLQTLLIFLDWPCDKFGRKWRGKGRKTIDCAFIKKNFLFDIFGIFYFLNWFEPFFV